MGYCVPEVNPRDLAMIYHISPNSYIEELSLITRNLSPTAQLKLKKDLLFTDTAVNMK